MIAEIATGSAAIGDSLPGEALVVVVKIDPPMPSAKYDVTILHPAEIPAADLEVAKQTATEVTIAVTRPQGNASNPGATIHVLAIQRTGKA